MERKNDLVEGVWVSFSSRARVGKMWAPKGWGNPASVDGMVVAHMASFLGWLCSLPAAFLIISKSLGLHCSFSYTLTASCVIYSGPACFQLWHILCYFTGLTLTSWFKNLTQWHSFLMPTKPYRWCHGLLPAVIVTWPSWTMAAATSEFLYSWVLWKESWENNFHDEPVWAGCPTNCSILKEKSYKWVFTFTCLSLRLVELQQFLRSPQDIFPIVSVKKSTLFSL